MADHGENPIGGSNRRVDRSSDNASLDLIDAIKQLAKEGLKNKAFFSYDELLYTLRRWWCRYYKRPYKDPMLDQYTIEELLFEYFDIEGPEDQKVVDKEKMLDDDRDWAAEEEARELAELEAVTKTAEVPVPAPAPAPLKNDTIPEAKDDAAWADKHDPPPLVNPTADQAVQGGDITATFGG